MLQGHDERDPASLVSSRPRLLATATEDWPLAPLFAFVKTHAWKDADAATHEAFGELVEELGGQVTEISLDHTTERGYAANRLVQKVEMAVHFGPLLDRAPELLSDNLRQQLEDGRRVPGVEYIAALNAREEFYATVEDLLLNYGTILTPGRARARSQGPGVHRQPGLLRLLDLSRRAGGDAAAAGGRRPAHGRAAHRRAPRRRPPAAHRAMAGAAPGTRQRIAMLSLSPSAGVDGSRLLMQVERKCHRLSAVRLNAIIASGDLALHSRELAGRKAIEPALGLAALLRELPQIDPRQINAEALHDLRHIHLAEVDAERAQQVALIGREQGLQGLGIEELVDALQVGALERGCRASRPRCD